ncbi:MAG TPA: SIMPL domain-containing protein [Xanthomonadaceae bacterium]|nr:SIMPL domain-containing protein [Xanthomonadaceae bacterium]
MTQRIYGISMLAGLFIGAGLVGAGWLAAEGMKRLRTEDRYVIVKGLAERYVDADLVVWPVNHAVAGNELEGVQADLDANAQKIRAFLNQAGFEDAEIALSPPRVTDQESFSYGDNAPRNRYRAEGVVTLRTDKVDAALVAMQRAGELVREGVLLTFNYGPEGMAAFEFTALNDIKPALIAEATANARESAEQFAKDSGAVVGGIRSANQGVIDISPRDQSSPQVKKVRVVTTVEYFLVD